MTKHTSRLGLGLAALVMALLLLAINGAPAHAEDAQWLGKFWNNTTLSGEPVLVRHDNTIDFHWGDGSPAPEVNDDNFSAQWTRRLYFSAGTYRFIATMDDAMRVFVDGRIVMDHWRDSQEHTATVDVSLSEGLHDIRVDYYEAGGVATAVFRWENISGGGGGGAFYPNWRGEYFANATLSGAPAVTRDDRYLDFNWGEGSPVPGVIPADFFSVRWTRTFSVVPGTYRLTLTSDDGARVFVNNQLLLDNWAVQTATTRSTIVTSTGAPFTARVEYFEQTGGALISARLDLLSSTGGSGTTGSCRRPATNQGVVTAERLNVRSGPSTALPVVSTMVRCDVAQLTMNTDPSRTWVQLVTPGGIVGWSSAQYLQLGTPTSAMTVTNQ